MHSVNRVFFYRIGYDIQKNELTVHCKEQFSMKILLKPDLRTYRAGEGDDEEILYPDWVCSFSNLKNQY